MKKFSPNRTPNHDHQALKAITKAAKLVKAFFIQKLVRKLKDQTAETNTTKQETLELQINEMKLVQYGEIAKLIFMMSIKNTKPEIGDSKLINKFIANSKMEKVLHDWKEKIEKSKELRMGNRVSKRPSGDLITQGKKMKNIIKDRNMGVNERTKAIFLDSLSNEADIEMEEQQEKRKQLKLLKTNNLLDKNNMPRKIDGVKTDLTPYMSSDMRNHRESFITNSSSSYNNSNNHSTGNTNERRHSASANAVANTRDSTYPKRQREPTTISTGTSSTMDGGPRGVRKFAKVNIAHDTGITSSSTRNSSKPSNSNVPIEVTKEIVANGKDWKSTGVHPSWAAKMISSQSSGTVNFTGKKIVFSDDD